MKYLISGIAAWMVFAISCAAAGDGKGGGASTRHAAAPSRYGEKPYYSGYPSPSYRPGRSISYSPVNGADYRYRQTCPFKHWHFFQDGIVQGVFRDFGR